MITDEQLAEWEACALAGEFGRGSANVIALIAEMRRMQAELGYYRGVMQIIHDNVLPDEAGDRPNLAYLFMEVADRMRELRRMLEQKHERDQADIEASEYDE